MGTGMKHIYDVNDTAYLDVGGRGWKRDEGVRFLAICLHNDVMGLYK